VIAFILILFFVLVWLNGATIDVFVDFSLESHQYGLSNHKDTKRLSRFEGIQKPNYM